MNETDGRASLEELQLSFNREVVEDKRAAAETAYALAFRYRNEDVDGRRRFDLAKIWATRSMDLLESLPSDTLADVGAGRIAVGGIPIPEMLHSGVVRNRLADVLI
ncbi:hypothetical protein ACQPW3_07485 [Actinosynnema sp. CA-248983]